MSATHDWLNAQDLAGLGRVRGSHAGDAIDGVMPRAVIEPTESSQVAAALAWASRERLTTVIRGSGTKLGWGRVPGSLDVVLATSQLNSLVVHRHGDLTATVHAGVTLVDLNRQLAAQRQWLPVDSAFGRATIGGLLATNDSGPLRHRYGTPRDLLIGITLATTDGKLVKSGGHVVKNVAGYDLGKLVSGSYGTLAAIVDATFKLLPIPSTSHTVSARYADHGALAKDVAVVAGSQLDAIAFDVRVVFGRGRSRLDPTQALYIRFATSPEATETQASAARALLTGDTEVLTGEREAVLWSEQVRRPWARAGVVVRLSWAPASLPKVLALLEKECGGAENGVELTGRAAAGAGLLRFDVEDESALAVISALRSHADLVSNVVVLGQSTAFKRAIDPWGTIANPASVLQSLKRTFDPAGILNAGRGPI